jgi:hypothetical protein
MINRDELTARLKREVTTLVDDLRTRADQVDEVGDVVREQWSAAVAAERTAHDMETWREDLLTQVAVSWVLTCVFIRFCEDNRLVTAPMISGRDEWRRWARDNQVAYFREHPEHAERDYLLHVFGQAAALPGLDEVLGEHNPLWQFGPSADAARDLIGLWRATDQETGELLWDFTDESWSTRFLGDLYQDLSEHAKKTYALLQTPDFVEEFILDRTLDPAIDEFGLTGPDGTGFRMIDPACGSGHFLLGAFDRLATLWLAKEPSAGSRSASAKALDSVFGVDLNPFAASIARFRLLVAALRFADVKTLAEAPNLNIQVAVGDSLLHGTPEGQLANIGMEAGAGSVATRHLYETEDADRVTRYLDQRYHAVVANPPYITPKDPAANAAYRKLYPDTCHRKYSLSVPFMERLFQLAERGASGRSAGFVGQITANSFMKREFGKKLIEGYIASDVDLSHVIDTSGAYIPGHGTPTVILLGRNRFPIDAQVRAVLSIRGEPGAPKVPADGLVWSSIEDSVDELGAENDFVSVANIQRSVLGSHPWSLQGGSAAPLKERIEEQRSPLVNEIESIGFHAISGEDPVYFEWPSRALDRRGVDACNQRPFVPGDAVRDWKLDSDEDAVFPYDDALQARLSAEVLRVLWPARTGITAGLMFGKTRAMRKMEWFEYVNLSVTRDVVPLSLAFASVATHNHFVLDRGGKVFKQTAPVIKLSAAASEDEHLQLLGLLNSSVACFWTKQVSHCKGSTVDSKGARQTSLPFEDFYDFDGTKLKQFPLAKVDVLSWSKRIDDLAQDQTLTSPGSVASVRVPTVDLIEKSRRRVAAIRSEMVWLQEELDWRCMYAYGITDTDLSFSPDQVFELGKGERSFEVALARKIENGDTTSTWFERHGSTPVTEPPVHWPGWYTERVLQRLELIESDKFVNLLERPEYKRRWNWESWDKLAHDALQKWLLTRLEDRRYWPSIEPKSVAQLADIARGDADFMHVAELYRDHDDVDLVDQIGELAKSDAVPFLAAWRYKESGLRKREAWERTWDLQRQEDAGVDVGKIPVPPKYGSGDFRSAVSWKLRGKLDVPKERFVAYPGLGRDNDTTAVIGWAGWDHLEQAQALAAMYQQRRDTDGWPTERLVPILAGLHELVPWLRQWHNEIDPDIGQGLGDYYADYLAAEMQRHGLGANDLAAWQPPVAQRGRKTAKKAST